MRTPARAALVVALLFTASRTHAQTATAGTPVAGTHLAAETRASVIPDGSGGAYVGFKIAYRSAALPAEIAVSHLTPLAKRDPGWSSLPMVPAGSLPQNAPPGASRVLRAPAGDVLVFADYSTTSTPKDIVRAVGASGADHGYPGFQPTYAYNVLNAVPRSDGGALIFSKVTGGGPNLLATHVATNGTATEVFIPIDITSGFSLGGDQIAGVPSGAGGGIAVLQEPFVGGSTAIDLIAVRVDGSGNPAWVPSHRNIASPGGDQRDQVAVSDGADGIVVAWDDARNSATTPDIFAQRLLASGAIAPGWVSNGRTICSLAGAQAVPAIADDGAGGAWIAWQDDRNTLTNGIDLYFTHILANGTFAAGFPANGRALCSTTGDQTAVQLVNDGSGGLFVVWLDARDGEQDLFAQHLDTSGNPTAGWAATGNAVCTDGAPQIDPSLASVSTGRAIVAWNDARTGTDIVYAVSIDALTGVDAPRAAATHLALAAGANPARGGVELRLDAADAGDVRVTLYDVAGRVQAERAVTGPMRAASVRFDGLRPGVYLARASQGGSIASTRVAVLD
jgi:hypothetical protein